MNDRKRNKLLLESLLLIIVITSLGILARGFIALTFLFPAIFTIFTIRNGRYPGIMTIVISGSLVGLVAGMELGVFLILMSLPMTLVFSELIIRRGKSSQIIIANTVLFFILILLIFRLMELSGLSLVKVLEDSFNKAMSNQIRIYESMGLTSLEMSEKTDFLETSYKYTLLVIPSIFLILSLIVSYLNYVIISIGLERMKLRLANRPQFSKFRLPGNFLYAIGIVLIGSIFLKNSQPPYIETTLINIQVLIGFAFAIQGLSVIEHILVRKRVKLWIRTISYFIFMFLPPIASLLPIVGIGDMVFDFKKIKRSKS